MAYYWRAEDIPELAVVPRADRELWWRIARKQSYSGLVGRLAVWLDGLPWVFLVLVLLGTSHRYLQGMYTAIVCAAIFVAALFTLNVCLDQPMRRRWLREHMREYRNARPWLQSASPVVDSEAGGETPSRYWRLRDIPELRGLSWKRRHKLWSEAVSRGTSPQILLGTMLVVFMAGVVAGGASLALLPAISPLWLALPAIACASFVTDRWFRWPAARRWLREHAHELDRYAPA